MNKSDLRAKIEEFKKGAVSVYHELPIRKIGAIAAAAAIVSSTAGAAVMKDLYEDPVDHGVSYTAHDVNVHGVDVDKLPPGVVQYIHDLDFSLPGADNGIRFSNGDFSIYQQLPKDVLAALILSDYEPETSDIGLPEKELRKTYEKAKDTIKDIENYLSMFDPLPVAGASGFGDVDGVDISDGSGNSNGVKKSGSNELKWYEKILKYIGDWMDRKIDTDAKVDAYGAYVDGTLAELTEEQKEAKRCADDLTYDQNTPGCPGYVQVESIHNQLGGESTTKSTTYAEDAKETKINDTKSTSTTTSTSTPIPDTITEPNEIPNGPSIFAAQIKDMPYDISKMQAIYDSAKGETKSDKFKRVGVGSCGDNGDDICFGFELSSSSNAAVMNFNMGTSAKNAPQFGYVLYEKYMRNFDLGNKEVYSGEEYYVSEDGKTRWVVLKNAHKILKTLEGSNGFYFSFNTPEKPSEGVDGDRTIAPKLFGVIKDPNWS